MPKLITLEEHNAIMRDQHRDPFNNEPRKNGVACPKCGKELYDWTPNYMLAVNPPQKTVRCKKCHYQGYRLA